MPSGNVGIGINTPREKLDVWGNAIVNGSMVSFNIQNTTSIETATVLATGNIQALNITATNQLLANGNIFSQNNCTITRQIFMTGTSVTSTTYIYLSVTEHNGSRYVQIPIRATNAYVYCYFGEIGGHALYLKEGDTYHKRMGVFSNVNNWDFAQTYNGNVRIWYHWRSVGDRITLICKWFN